MRPFHLFLIATSLLASALVAALLYKLRSWSKKELWRILAFGSATLIVSGLNLVIPAQDKTPLFGALLGFAFFFALENYAIIHSCPEYLEEGAVGIASFTGSLMTLALTMHSLLDGVILGVSAHLGQQEFWSVFAGMSIHKFADAMTLIALLESAAPISGSPRFSKNLGLALAVTLATPFGALLSSLLLYFSALTAPSMNLFAGLSAGSLIYIGASDILPRIHRLKDPPCFVFFICGLMCMVAFLSVFN